MTATSAEYGTPTEETIASIWAAQLGVDHISPSSDFFALGGDSLHMLSVIVTITERVGLDLSPSTFFESPTLAEFCQVVDRELRALDSGSHDSYIEGAI